MLTREKSIGRIREILAIDKRNGAAFLFEEKNKGAIETRERGPTGVNPQKRSTFVEKVSRKWEEERGRGGRMEQQKGSGRRGWFAKRAC